MKDTKDLTTDKAPEGAFPPTNTERENGRGPWYWVRAEAVTGPEEPVYHLSDGRGIMRCQRDIPGRVVKEEPYHSTRRCLRCTAAAYREWGERQGNALPTEAPPATALSADPSREEMQEEITKLTGALRAAQSEHKSDVEEAQAFIRQMADEYHSLELAARRLVKGEYRMWASSGGGEECEHGYNLGIACRGCDEALVFEHRLRGVKTELFTSAASAPKVPPSPAEAGLREIQERQELDRAATPRDTEGLHSLAWWRKAAVATFGPTGKHIEWLDEMIAESGPDELIVKNDGQMLYALGLFAGERASQEAPSSPSAASAEQGEPE